jgi:flagellar protein FliO/FliZ
MLPGLASTLLLVDTAVAAPATPVPGGVELLSFAGSLLVVVASILAFGWLYGRLRPGMGQASERIRIVATRPLGPKERLLVVDLNGEQLLVGVSPGHMQTLHKLERPLAEETVDAESGGFAAKLRTLLAEGPK